MQDLSPQCCCPQHTPFDRVKPPNPDLSQAVSIAIATAMTQRTEGLTTPVFGPPPRSHCHAEDTATVLHVADLLLKSPSG